MSSETEMNGKITKRPVIAEDLVEGKKSFSVVLEGVRSEIETRDSFAIKFALLTKAPLPRIKHLVRTLPSTVWSGSGRSRAESVLRVIEEAGGRGTIIEGGSAAPAKPAETEPKSDHTCAWCGFPMKEGESVCGFCMTPVKGAVPTAEPHPPSRKKQRAIEPKRLLIYGAILAVGIIVLLVIR